METIFVISIFMVLGYLFYQLFRNEKIFKIRYKWLISNDERHYKYTYDYMFVPKLKNWFGLKWPNDKNF